MAKILQNVRLTCTKGSSNKFYNVEIVLGDGGLLVMQSTYGAIGQSGKSGVGGSFSIDVKEAIRNRTIDNNVSKLAAEANKQVQSKVKKGYDVVSGNTRIDPVDVIKAIHKLFPDDVNAATQQPKAPVAGAFDVEIIGISMGVISVAKVLEDFNYDVLGEAKNPKKRSVKTGDVVSVLSVNNQLELV